MRPYPIMYLTHLSLTNFRSFARLDIEIPRRVILVTGDNAQGKTTILEAIYFLAAFASFQTSTERQLVNSFAVKAAEEAFRSPTAREDEKRAVGRITAHFRDGQRTRKLEVRLIIDPVGTNGQRLRKEVLLDGIKRQVNDAVGNFNAVLFIPQMSQTIEGGPDERRRYLNLTLAQVFPGYAQSLSDYTKALEQRNALLKTLAERGGSPDQLEVWDRMLAEHGAKIIHWRIQAIQELEKEAARAHHRLTRGTEVLRLAYQPAYDPMPRPERQLSLRLDAPVDRSGLKREEIEKGFLEQLSRTHVEEIGRGVTTIGPHRDELRFLANQIDLGDYGSRGQVRTALLSLKLAEVEWMKARTGRTPVLLLDEVLAELDLQRRADLLAYVNGMEQALLTTTDLHLFTPEFVQQAQTWEVRAGTVEVTKEN
jgi:DNA replication and repair protein RecF